MVLLEEEAGVSNRPTTLCRICRRPTLFAHYYSFLRPFDRDPTVVVGCDELRNETPSFPTESSPTSVPSDWAPLDPLRLVNFPIDVDEES